MKRPRETTHDDRSPGLSATRRWPLARRGLDLRYGLLDRLQMPAKIPGDPGRRRELRQPGVSPEQPGDPISGAPILKCLSCRITKIENGTILSDGTFSVNKTLVENNDYTLNVEDITGLPPNTESRGQHFRFSDNGFTQTKNIKIEAEYGF